MKFFKIEANVILTFENQPQEVYDAKIDVAMLKDDNDLERFEIEVIKDVLRSSERTHEELIKISLCFDTSSLSSDDEDTQEALIYLCRFNSKYYFQPNQRDPHEEAIQKALGIATKTKDMCY